MRTFVLLLVGLLIIALPASASVVRNIGPQVPWTFQGNHLTAMSPTAPRTAVHVLYCPSEADDPAYRAGIQAALPAGSVVDYFDARNAVPSVSLLAGYQAVHTWSNYAYFDAVGMGDALANYVDGGGRVVLGAFCTYCAGNSLQGRIMTAAYCPVYSPSCSNHFTTAGWSGDDADKCDYQGVSSWSAMYRDYLSLQGTGVQWGSFTDREIADAVGPTEANDWVHYVNGSGGNPILVDPNIEVVVANACWCTTQPTPVKDTTWGAVKALYR